MPHPLVVQLRFSRSELVRCLQGISEEDACRRTLPMNCPSWIVGHLANQEHGYWVMGAQKLNVAPGLYDLVGYGRPATTPSLAGMWAVWQTVTAAADHYLDALTTKALQTHLEWEGRPWPESVGTMLWRNIHHYWFHIGEAHAMRQVLGHQDLPDFVGDLSAAVYTQEECP